MRYKRHIFSYNIFLWWILFPLWDIRRMLNYIKIEGRELKFCQGVFNKNENSICLNQNISVSINKTLLGGIFNYADITIKTPVETLYFKGVKYGADLYDSINKGIHS